MKFKKYLEESSLSRIWQHIQNPENTFAVISAFRETNSDEKNWEEHLKLKADIRKKYGHIPQKSGYTYQEGDRKGETVDEYSFFVPNISKEEALKLGKKYNQESILFKDSSGFYMIYTDKRYGKVGITFKKDPKGSLTFDPKVYKYAFSQLLRANKNNKVKFAYVVKEGKYPSLFSGYSLQGKDEELKMEWVEI